MFDWRKEKIVYRDHGSVVDIRERRPSREHNTHEVDSHSDNKPLSKIQVFSKLRGLAALFKMDLQRDAEEKANARAIELISEAAERFNERDRIVFKPDFLRRIFRRKTTRVIRWRE